MTVLQTAQSQRKALCVEEAGVLLVEAGVGWGGMQTRQANYYGGARLRHSPYSITPGRAFTWDLVMIKDAVPAG